MKKEPPGDDNPPLLIPEEEDRNMRLRGYATVFGGFLIHLTLGNFFTLGNMSTYLMSYLRSRDGSSVTYSYSIWISSLMYLGQGTLMAVGGMLERRIGARWTCLIGCSMFCISISLTYFTINYSFFAVAITYGFMSCLGLGISYIAPLAIGMKWYPGHKGLVNGTILAGFGLGALIFNQVQTLYLNPHNKSPDLDGYFTDPEILDCVPSVFLFLGALYGCIQLIGISLLFQSPEEKHEPMVYSMLLEGNGVKSKYGNEAVAASAHISKSNYCLVQDDMKPSQMMRQKEFYMLWATFAFNSQCVQFTNTYYKTYGQTFIQDDYFLSWVGSIAAVFNCLGRITWGMIQDRTSYKNCMLILSACLSALMLSFIAAPYGMKTMFTIWVLLIFFFFSGVLSIMPTATAQAFGAKYAGTNYGIIFTAPALSSVAGAVLIQIILTELSWFGAFCLIAACSFSAFLVTVFIPIPLESVRWSLLKTPS